MKRLTLFFFILCNTAEAEERFWSEGACIEEEMRFEGATRGFYNRGAGQPWKNPMGDWLDNYFTPQGPIPFSTLIIPVKEKSDKVEITVTSLVKLWQEGTLTNQGFRLTTPKKRPLLFIAKEQENYSYQPMLELHTSSSYFEIPVEADTYLNKSTYRCLGSSPQLNAMHPVLMRFDISSIKEPITKAILKLTLAKKVIKPTTIDIFSVNIEEDLDMTMKGLSSHLLPDEYLNMTPNILFYTQFENEDWSKKWISTARGNYQTTNYNIKEKFSSLSGKALEITIKKGEFLGIGAKYLLPTNLTKAYFRYYLRLGDSWEINTTGKLPGFAGTYHNKSFRAGWGGRKSNGSNGWSARMFMNATLSSSNTLPNTTPIGNYLYHSDMKKKYGDMEYWHLNNESLLKKNTWYSIEQNIQFNSPNKKDGQLNTWVNGKLVYSNTAINFSDNPYVGLESIWLNVYHGGKTKAPKDLSLFIDDLVISRSYIGPRKSIIPSPIIAK
jgi:hypothetical protein